MGDGAANPASVWDDERTHHEVVLRADAHTTAQTDATEWATTYLADLRECSVGDAIDLLISRLDNEATLSAEWTSLAHKLRSIHTDGHDAWIAREHFDQQERLHVQIRSEISTMEHGTRSAMVADHISKQVARMQGADLLAAQGEEYDKLMAKGRRTAEAMALCDFDQLLVAAQHRLWPNVEEDTQKGNEAETCAAEWERIYPGLLAAATKQAEEEAGFFLITERERVSTDLLDQVRAEGTARALEHITALHKELEVQVCNDKVNIIRAAAASLGFALVATDRTPVVTGPPAKKPRSRSATDTLNPAKGAVLGNKRSADGRSMEQTVSTVASVLVEEVDHPMVLLDAPRGVSVGSDLSYVDAPVMPITEIQLQESFRCANPGHIMVWALPIVLEVEATHQLDSSLHAALTLPSAAAPLAPIIIAPTAVPPPPSAADEVKAMLAEILAGQKKITSDVAGLSTRMTNLEAGKVPKAPVTSDKGKQGQRPAAPTAAVPPPLVPHAEPHVPSVPCPRPGTALPAKPVGAPNAKLPRPADAPALMLPPCPIGKPPLAQQPAPPALVIPAPAPVA
jgi:hypothetical protein